jgi:YVTN family beta-propeller protein
MMMSGTVLVLDATTLETTATIAVGDMPEEVSFSVDGKLGFVANEMANSVTIINALTHKVLKTLAVAGGPVGAWQGGDNQMYVDSEQGKTITVIDAASQSITATIQLNFTPGMAALAKDGKLWVTNTDAGAVALFDPKTGKLVKSIPTGAGAHGVLIDPIQMRVYVTNQGAASISVIDMMSLSVIASVQVGNKPNGLALVSK